MSMLSYFILIAFAIAIFESLMDLGGPLISVHPHLQITNCKPQTPSIIVACLQGRFSYLVQQQRTASHQLCHPPSLSALTHTIPATSDNNCTRYPVHVTGRLHLQVIASRCYNGPVACCISEVVRCWIYHFTGNLLEVDLKSLIPCKFFDSSASSGDLARPIG